ncbi:MAG: trigger factor [Steroidobacteraceae bacterium]
MQISVESTGALERRMNIQVPAERIAQAINTRLQSLSRTVRINGFRPGKVPVVVVKQQYGAAVRQEVIEDLVQKSYSEAVTEQKLNPAGGPRIEEFKADEGQELSYLAVFEVYPEIKLQGIEGLVVNQPKVEVAVADIDAMIDNLRRQQAIYVKVERAAKDTDRVTIDFEGTLDGVAFEGGKGSNFPVVVGGGRMLPDFEAGLHGISAGETKQVTVNFPADYAAANLAGKAAVFSITAQLVEEQQLPEANDEFAKIFGIPEGGIAKLREDVADNMRRELADNVRGRVRQQVFDGLLAANQIEVPSVLVANQVRDMQQEAARQQGVRDAAQLPPAEPFQEPARKRVALGLVLGEVIKSSGVSIDRARVQAKLQEMVEQYPDPAQAMKAYRDNQDAQRQIENLVLEEQVIEWLLERAKLTEQPMSFKELMNFGA